jgi:hypothetical protein
MLQMGVLLFSLRGDHCSYQPICERLLVCRNGSKKGDIVPSNYRNFWLRQCLLI